MFMIDWDNEHGLAHGRLVTTQHGYLCGHPKLSSDHTVCSWFAPAAGNSGQPCKAIAKCLH